MNGELSAFEGSGADADDTDGGDATAGDSDGSEAGYRLDVKRSARRASARAGTRVLNEGTLLRFDSKPQARAWARELTRQADRTVWVQDAHPKDGTADGYLVARRYDPERTRGREQTAVTDQTSLEEL